MVVYRKLHSKTRQFTFTSDSITNFQQLTIIFHKPKCYVWINHTLDIPVCRQSQGKAGNKSNATGIQHVWFRVWSAVSAHAFHDASSSEGKAFPKVKQLKLIEPYSVVTAVWQLIIDVITVPPHIQVLTQIVLQRAVWQIDAVMKLWLG